MDSSAAATSDDLPYIEAVTRDPVSESTDIAEPLDRPQKRIRADPGTGSSLVDAQPPKSRTPLASHGILLGAASRGAEQHATNYFDNVAIVFCGIEPTGFSAGNSLGKVIQAWRFSQFCLVSDHSWMEFVAAVKTYDTVIFCPFLHSFGVIMLNGNPVVARDAEGSRIYGLPHLDPRVKEIVDYENLLIARMHKLMASRRLENLATVICGPDWGAEDIFLQLASCRNALRNDGVNSSIIASCCFDPTGGSHRVPVIYCGIRCIPDKLCPHTPCCGPPALVDNFRDRASCGKLYMWVTLKAITLRHRTCKSSPSSSSTLAPPEPAWMATRPQVVRSLPAREMQLLQRPRDEADDRAIGGLRRTANSVMKIPQVKPYGLAMASALDTYAASSTGKESVRFLFSLIGGDKIKHTCPQDNECRQCRIESIGRESRRVILRSLGWSGPIMDNVAPTADNGYVSTHLSPTVFRAWSEKAGDPDACIADWLTFGAPAGMCRQPGQFGIFPPAADDPDADLGNMAYYSGRSPPEEQTNSADDIRLIRSEVTEMTDKGWMRQFKSASEVESFVGGKFVVSKLFVQVQVKGDTVKNRVLMDCKRSLVSASSQKGERVFLPRTVDCIFDTLEVMRHSPGGPSGKDTEFLVLDIADAFWSIPLHPDERRYFVCHVDNTYYVLMRTAQGSQAAPLCWSRVMAMSARMSQSTCPPQSLRSQVYVDDPILSAQGQPSYRDTLFARVILTWLAQGHRLAWHKAKRGPEVQWISMVVQATPDAVVARSKPELLQDVQSIVHELMQSNIVPHKRLRTLVGKVVHISSLIYTMRPFARMLWAPLLKDQPSNAPKNCCWLTAIRTPLLWLLAFLKGEHLRIERVFTLSDYLRLGRPVAITTDASPWGLGGVLTISNMPVAYFSSPISSHDETIHQLQIGDCRGQQAWEALAILVAIRIWSQHLTTGRIVLSVKSDSITALTVVLEAKGRGPSVALIAREIALDLASATFVPSVVEHIPGASNVISDALSRLQEPGHSQELPPYLDAAEFHQAEERTRHWYKTLLVEDNWSTEAAGSK